ncbi:unnamed protein product, partial [Rotaria sp. Silwood1]
MIGAFTVVTTLQESKRVQLQREADMTKLERQAELQQEAEKRQGEVDALKIKEQQEHESQSAKEIRMQNIYDTFMKEMLPIVLKENINITIPELVFARAKTTLTLDQIDPTRKWYLVKFLYDNHLLYENKPGMRYIDLADSDLSNVRFGANKNPILRLDLRGIRLTRIQLRNSSFGNVVLNQANFEYSDLNNSNFIHVVILGANFRQTILENCKFILSQFQNTSFKKSQLKLSSWTSISTTHLLSFNNIDYSYCDLSEAIFHHLVITTSVRLDEANLERVTFSDIKLSTGTVFKDLNMKMSKFIDVSLLDGKFFRCNMMGAIFKNLRWKNVLFHHVDLQHTQFDEMHGSGNIEFIYVNLVGSNLNITNDKI